MDGDADACQATVVIEVVVDGKPVPWLRTIGGRRTDPRYDMWKQGAQGLMLQARMPAPLLEGPVVAEVEVHADQVVARFCPLNEWVGVKLLPRLQFSRPEAPARNIARPKVRGDLDNYVKAVLDAGNRVIYQDDHQVVLVVAWFVREASDEVPADVPMDVPG